MIKYSKTGERTMKNEFDNLKVMHEYAWGLIIRGTVDKKSPALHPTFGTTGLKGMPELRTVVLRQADQMAATLEVHTDLKSRKIEELFFEFLLFYLFQLNQTA